MDGETYDCNDHCQCAVFVYGSPNVRLAFIMGALKSITAVNGVQCVVITGLSMKPEWCAVSKVSPGHPRLLRAHDMAKRLIPSG